MNRVIWRLTIVAMVLMANAQSTAVSASPMKDLVVFVDSTLPIKARTEALERLRAASNTDPLVCLELARAIDSVILGSEATLPFRSSGYASVIGYPHGGFCTRHLGEILGVLGRLDAVGPALVNSLERREFMTWKSELGTVVDYARTSTIIRIVERAAAVARCGVRPDCGATRRRTKVISGVDRNDGRWGEGRVDGRYL